MGSVQGLSIFHGVVKCEILLKDQVSLTTHFFGVLKGNIRLVYVYVIYVYLLFKFVV